MLSSAELSKVLVEAIGEPTPRKFPEVDTMILNMDLTNLHSHWDSLSSARVSVERLRRSINYDATLDEFLAAVRHLRIVNVTVMDGKMFFSFEGRDKSLKPNYYMVFYQVVNEQPIITVDIDYRLTEGHLNID